MLNKVINNLVITSIQFNENPDTGYGLYCDISLEQVTFATLKLTEIPRDVVEAVRPGASEKQSLGRTDSTVKDSDDPDNDDPDSKKDDIDRLRTIRD